MATKPPRNTVISPLRAGFDGMQDWICEAPNASFASAVTFIADHLADRDIVNVEADEVELMAAMLLSFSSKTNCGFIEAMPSLIELFRRWAAISLVQTTTTPHL